MFELGAVDLGFSRARYTWCNNHWGHKCIRERIDCVSLIINGGRNSPEPQYFT